MADLDSALKLTKQLIEIPSYIDASHDERGAIDFLEKYAEEHLPGLVPSRYKLEGEARENLLLSGKKKTRLLFVGHVDTVPPSDGWETDPVAPIVKENYLYGLGAADMKTSIACLLVALQSVDPQLLDEVAVLLYLDEEYHFAGMKQAIRDQLFTRENQPELVISMDGHQELLSGCRGLIKVDIETIGKSGHASNPDNGINAIMATTEAYQALDALLPSYGGANLGRSTMNIALMRAGAVEDTNDPTEMQTVGNVIPNYAFSILEIRTASPKLNGAEVERILRIEFEKRGLIVQSFKVEHDLGAWPGSSDNATMLEFLRGCYEKSGIEWKQSDPQYIGFIDVQILAETIDSPIYVIGAGGENLHGANEHVAITNIDSTVEVYKYITEDFLGV